MTIVQSRNSLLVAALCLFAIFSPSLEARAQRIEVRHAQGTTSVPLNPKKVVAFDLASLDTLTALGIHVAGVPGGVLPKYLSEYASAETAKVGTVFEPDFEAVNALAPDLIIVSGRTAPKYAALARIAPTIDLSPDQTRYVASAQENIRTLGRIFGKEKEADAALAKLQASIAALRQKAGTAGAGALILTTGGKISTYGAGSRFGLIFTDYGFRQADPDIKVGVHGQPASFEYLLEKNPDWLFVIDRDAAIGQEGKSAGKLLDNEIVGQTTAWKKKQVVYLDPESWYLVGGGVTALANEVDQLARALDGK